MYCRTSVSQLWLLKTLKQSNEQYFLYYALLPYQCLYL